MTQPRIDETMALTKSSPEAPSSLVKLNPLTIATMQHNIQMSQRLVPLILEEGIDYGHLPGLDGKCLFDPGASNIINAWNCFPQHEVIYHEESDNLICWVIQAKLISRDTQAVVGSGVGGCSTRETKYKYRWIQKPEEFGYSLEQIKTFKQKDGKYRIPNPEYGDLSNTILLMASKRAECDAARSLPGVNSGLKKLFTKGAPRPPAQVGQQPSQKNNPWANFWTWCASNGLSNEKVHEILGVKSTKDWVDQGHALDEAQMKVLAFLQKQTRGKGVVPERSSVIQGEIPLTIPKTLTEVARVANQQRGMQSAEVWGALGYKSMQECSMTPQDAYYTLKALKEQKPPPRLDEETPSGDGLFD